MNFSTRQIYHRACPSYYTDYIKNHDDWIFAGRYDDESISLCEECLKRGRYTKATVVDHIVPHRGDPKLFWDRNNWKALCRRCHDQKTGREDSNPVYHY